MKICRGLYLDININTLFKFKMLKPKINLQTIELEIKDPRTVLLKKLVLCSIIDFDTSGHP